MSEPFQSIDPSEYSNEYFLTTCDGHEEFLSGGGAVLPRRLRALGQFLLMQPGMRLLDVGCGRGEVAVHCGLRGVQAVGVDYAADGLHLAQQAIAHANGLQREGWQPPVLSLGNAKGLPFHDSLFDRVVMSDIVEHLHPHELRTALEEVYRVLAPGGELLVHTMPNLWYYKYGYPLFRLVQRARGVTLPANPRDRFRFSHVHVNEQTPSALRRTLGASSFRQWRVWLYDYREYAQYGPAMRQIMCLLTRLPLVNWIFCDDIFARARK